MCCLLWLRSEMATRLRIFLLQFHTPSSSGNLLHQTDLAYIRHRALAVPTDQKYRRVALHTRPSACEHTMIIAQSSVRTGVNRVAACSYTDTREVRKTDSVLSVHLSLRQISSGGVGIQSQHTQTNTPHSKVYSCTLWNLYKSI